MCKLGACTRACVADNECSGSLCIDQFCARPDQVPCVDPVTCTAKLHPKACVRAICTSLGRCSLATEADGAVCDDGDPCTIGDACAAAGCKAGTGGCDCAKNADCAVSNPCLGKAACVAGHCQPVAGSAVVCAADRQAGPCAIWACDPKTAACAPEPRPDGTACDDGQACSTGDACQAGACAPGPNSAWLATFAVGASAGLRAVARFEGGVVAVGTLAATKKQGLVAVVGPGGGIPKLQNLGAAGDRELFGVAPLGAKWVAVGQADGLAGWIVTPGPSSIDQVIADSSGQALLSVAPAPGGGAVAVGYRILSIFEDVWFVRLDPAGKILQSANALIPSFAARGLGVVARGPDIVIAGYRQPPLGEPIGLAMRVDAGGTKLWQTESFGGATALAAAATAADDGLLFAGWTGTGPLTRGIVVRTDGAGKALWQFQLPAGSTSKYIGVAEAGPAVFAVGEGKGDGMDLRLDRLTPTGQLVEALGVALAGTQGLAGLALDANGTLYVAGTSSVPPAPTSLPLWGRAAPHGHLGCSAAGQCLAMVLSACDDADPCTLDRCVPASGTCTHEAAPVASICSRDGQKQCIPAGKCQ